MDLFKFIEETDGLENSLNFAMNYGLLPDRTPKNCPKCGRQQGMRWTKYSRNSTLPYMFVCAQRECRFTFGISRSTIFDRLSFPLTLALRLIYFWLLKISVKDSADQLQLTEVAVNEWFQCFREVCAFNIINYTKAIGGPGHVVEICEHCLQTKRQSYDLWLFTGVDRNTGHNFVIHVDNLDCETLWPIINNYILPGTKVVTSMDKDFNSKKEYRRGSESFSFVHPNKCPRTDTSFTLDELWNVLNKYIENEATSNEPICKELYVYQFLYFNRDETCNQPASQQILTFLNDINQVYPGFMKENNLQRKSRRLSSVKIEPE